jgi:CxxC motif-containing protein (DUF1111 family)
MAKSMMRKAGIAVVASCLLSIGAFAQVDPGVRGGLANTGGGLQSQGIPIPHTPMISANPNHPELTANVNEMALFLEGVKRMGQLESICDTCSVAPFGVGDGNPVPGEIDPDFPQHMTNSNGLGTIHNADNCLECHAQPTLGGSGGFIAANKGDVAQNPQFGLVPHRFGRKNVVPVFETQFGPIREVRFINNPDGTPDGGVHALWTITGDIEDPFLANCKVAQPDFNAAIAANNISFRIPLQIFGLGLIESIEDLEIMAQHDATAVRRGNLGIGGIANRSGNDGTISRFGWKAQNKSLAIFAGEAYNVEMGVTNDVFPQARNEDHNCAQNKPEPNDINRVDLDDAQNHAFNNPLHELPDWQMFMITMRFTDGPQPAANPSESAVKGRQIFSTIGCDLCHTPTMKTGGTSGSDVQSIAGPFNSPILVDRPVNLFSDLLVHHMGAGLSDGITQGAAGPDQFRTTPLWGVGQRIFFLHDGRTNNLLQAIEAHASVGSEANGVITNFNNLNKTDKQAILDFLRSL